MALLNMRKMKIFSPILICAACLMLTGMAQREVLDEQGIPLDFSTADYLYDWKRIPLVYPFEIVGWWRGDAAVENWEHWDKKGPREPVDTDKYIHRIIRFSQTNGIVFGACDTGWVNPTGERRYFSFNPATSNIVFITNKNDFAEHCKSFGGDFSQTRTFDVQWTNYWHPYRQQKSTPSQINTNATVSTSQVDTGDGSCMKKRNALSQLLISAASRILSGSLQEEANIDERDESIGFLTIGHCNNSAKRIPLVYPFEIIEHQYVFHIGNWKEHRGKGPRSMSGTDGAVHNITRFAQTNGIVYGECDIAHFYATDEHRYFTFNPTTGKTVFIPNENDFAEHCKSFGGDLSQLLPFKVQWTKYWDAYYQQQISQRKDIERERKE